MSPNRAALVAAARDSISRGSKSFRAASRLFDRPTRERAWLLYAWCRACDDLADGQEMGHNMVAVDDGPARVALIRRKTAVVLAGGSADDPAFDALGIVAAECAIPASLADDVIDGFALDAAGWRPYDERDLLRYCYHVAGAVGVMMALVMGVSPDDRATLDRASDLGLAFQLANIARDITEDAAAGRCYLPETWLEEGGVAPAGLLDPAARPHLAILGRRLADLAAAYEASARVGAAALPFRARWAVLSAAGIYGGIARKVAAQGERAWDRRVTTSRADKLGLVARAAIGAMRSPAPIDRAGLWTRPHELGVGNIS